MNFQYMLRSEKDPQGPQLHVFFPMFISRKIECDRPRHISFVKAGGLESSRGNAVHSQQVTRKN